MSGGGASAGHAESRPSPPAPMMLSSLGTNKLFYNLAPPVGRDLRVRPHNPDLCHGWAAEYMGEFYSTAGLDGSITRLPLAPSHRLKVD